MTGLFSLAGRGQCLAGTARVRLGVTNAVQKNSEPRYLLSAVVLAGGNRPIGMGLCLNLGMGLRTDRDLVLWGRRLSRRGILTSRRLRR